MLVTALLGNLTDHSFSPKLFSIYSKALGNREYAHVKFNIDTSDLRDCLLALPKFGFAGVNITLPYKMAVIPFLDNISDEAEASGAVNTIKVEGKKLIGYNTDIFGAMSAIKESLGREITSQDTAMIFGSGGAARALIAGFLAKKAKILVVCRNPLSENSINLSQKFHNRLSISSYEQLQLDDIKSFSVICNATSLGMHPNVDTSPLDHLSGDLSKDMMVNSLFFDVVFNPQNTKFMNQGKLMGGKVAGGTLMMIYQGVHAFKIWTGVDVPHELIEEAKNKLKELV
jgi:shikimate dehydrogenase